MTLELGHHLLTRLTGSRALQALASGLQHLPSSATASGAATSSSVFTASTPPPAPSIGWPQPCSYRAYSSTSISPSEQQGSTAAAAGADAAPDSAVEAAKELTRVIRAAAEPLQLLQLVQQHRGGLSPIHISAVFTRARHMCGEDGSRLQDSDMQQLQQQLSALAEDVQQQCGARELGDIMLACGHLQLPGVVTALLPALLQQDVLQGADAWSVSNAFGGLAQSGAQPASNQVQQLFVAMLSKSDASARHVGMALSAANLLEHTLSTEQLQSCVDKMLQTLQTASPHHIRTVLTAASSIGLRMDAEQLQRLLDRLVEQLPDADADTMSYTLYACARGKWQLHAHEVGLMLAGFAKLLPNASSNATHRLLLAVTCFDKHDLQAHVHHLQLVLDHMLALLPGASSLAICDTLYVASWLQLHTPQQQVQQAVEELVSDQRLPGCEPFEVSNVLRSVARLGYRVSEEQLDALMHRLLESPDAKPRYIADALDAAAAMGLHVRADVKQQLMARLPRSRVSRWRPPRLEGQSLSVGMQQL